jgi:hypothetical protein
MRRRLVMAGIVASGLAIAAAVALLELGGSDSSPRPAAPVSTPGLGQAPDGRQEPPWGFVANWQDFCYRPLPNPPHYAVEPPSEGRPCESGSTRFSTGQQIGLTVRAGATTDRIGVLWDAVEPRPPVTRGGRRVHLYDWAAAVGPYRAMLAAGVRPVVLAFGAPEWARQKGWRRPGACPAGYDKPCSYPPSRRHLSDWRAFIQALVRRLPQMLALEIWNEPNLPRFFAPKPSPPLYSRLLRAADQAVSASGVSLPLVTGGLAAGASPADGAIPAARFLARLYQLGGKASFDGIGTHPYPQRRPWVASMTANLDRLRRVRDRSDDPGTPLWITEVGIGGTSMQRPQASVSLARQGPILARMYHSTQRRDVRAFLIYALRDSPTEGPKFESFGVVHGDLRPKPAYCYLATRLGGVSACGSEP